MNGKYKLFHPKPTPIAAKIAEEWRDLLRPCDRLLVVIDSSTRLHLPTGRQARSEWNTNKFPNLS